MATLPKQNRISPKSASREKERKDTWEDLSTTVSTELHPAKPEVRVLPSVPPTSPAKSRVKGVRLLIVDGDPIRVDALAMDMRRLGAIVAVGDLSTNGYTQAAKFLPDAIVSEFVRPGEEGFQFIQTLRRHPLLRWSSIILSKWWKETGEGEGQVMLDQILDQLEELLAPIRIIEERIAAKRPLGDRIEMTGPAALLRLLANAKLTGVLFANDGWNKFSVELLGGKIVGAFRKGIDGKADDAMDAIIQLMLADSGKWTFECRPPQSEKDALDTEATLSRTNRILSRLFGQRLKSDPELADHIVVRPYFLRTASETVSPSAIEIARYVAEGAGLERFKKFFIRKTDLTEVERIVHTLFRCGAIRYVELPIATNRTQKDKDAANSVVNLLNALHDNPFAPKTKRIERKNRISRHGLSHDAAFGAYHLQDVPPEKVAVGKHRPIKLTLKEKSQETPLSHPTAPAPHFLIDPQEGSDTDVVISSSDDAFSEGSPTIRDESSKQIMASTALRLSHYQNTLKAEKSEMRHMWVAIVLALLLGGLLITGIILVSSVDRDRGDLGGDLGGAPSAKPR